MSLNRCCRRATVWLGIRDTCVTQGEVRKVSVDTSSRGQDYGLFSLSGSQTLVNLLSITTQQTRFCRSDAEHALIAPVSLVAILLAGFVLGLRFNAFAMVALSVVTAAVCPVALGRFGFLPAVCGTFIMLAMLQLGYGAGVAALGLTLGRPWRPLQAQRRQHD